MTEHDRQNLIKKKRTFTDLTMKTFTALFYTRKLTFSLKGND